MESNSKRRSFVKGKLMPFNRSTKPSSSNTVQYNSKARPIQSSPSATSVGYFLPQDFILTQPKHKLSFVAIDPSRDPRSSLLENPYGVVVDDKIDSKAASYISSVQARFKLCHLQDVK